MIVIQISDLNICERLIPFIEIAIDKTLGIAERFAEEKLFLFTGNIFATRTYLSAADINFFNKLLDKFENLNIIFSLGRFDYNIHAKDSPITYKVILEKRNIPFIYKRGTHEFFGIKWNFLLKNDPEPAADYSICYNFVPEKTITKGAICNGFPKFLNGNIACSGPLVQNNPEDGADFGIIIWKSEKPHFFLLDQKWPALKLFIRDDKDPETRTDFLTDKLYIQFSNCSRPYMEKYVNYIHTIVRCPIEVSEENYNLGEKIETHDIEVQLKFLEKKYENHPQRNYILSNYRQKIRPVLQTPPKWNIQYLIWDNLFSYRGGNHINFRELAPMTFIVGRNKSGKSSILDIITLALFNKPIRCGINDIINENSKIAYLKCGVTINGSNYTIERSFEKKSRDSGKPQLIQKFAFRLQNADGSSKDIECRNISEMYIKIMDLLSISYTQFRFNIAIQEEKSFLNFSTKEKKNLIHMLLGTNYINSVVNEVSTEKKEIHKQLITVKEVSKQKTECKNMIAAENEINKLEGELRNSAEVFSAFPQNLHHKNIFLANLNTYIKSIKKRQELIISGVKPISPLNNVEILKQNMELAAVFEEALKDETDFLFGHFAKRCSTIINKILQKISDFSISLEVQPEGFNFYILDNQKKINAASASGYQKFLLDLIARIVFLHASHITNFPLIIIDEGFGCLDDDNFIKVAKAISMLKKYFSILIITHIEELKSYADKMIKVQDRKVTFGKLAEFELYREALHDEKLKSRKK